MKLIIAISMLSLLIVGCVQRNPAPLAVIPARQIETQKVTLGNVQRIVKKIRA